MKKKIPLFLILVALATLSSSCQKDLTYSCDPDIDIWVKENIASIQQMTRSEFIEVNNASTQRGGYNAMTTEQKHNIWLEKLNAVITLEWTKKEVEHIESLINTIKNNLDWLEEIDDNNNEFHLWTYKWVEYAKEVLNWRDETIYAIVGTPNNIYKDYWALAESQKTRIYVD